MSVIARPSLDAAASPADDVVAAVAVTRAIEEMTGIEPDIKWPNDILS